MNTINIYINISTRLQHAVISPRQLH